MSPVIIDGKYTSDKIKKEIAQRVEEIVANGGKRPHLAAILVGNDGASQTYVGHKERACKEVGFDSTVLRFEDSITEAELLDVIAELNSDDHVDGMIVQLPLPKFTLIFTQHDQVFRFSFLSAGKKILFIIILYPH